MKSARVANDNHAKFKKLSHPLPPLSPTTHTQTPRRASDWKDQVAVVKVAVVTRGKELALKLYRTETEKLFAVCPIRSTGPAGIEPVTDSSRYFCLRIEDGKGNHAFIGEGKGVG